MADSYDKNSPGTRRQLDIYKLGLLGKTPNQPVSVDELAANFLGRAELAGYSAVVLTLDTFELSWRERDIQNAYLPFIRGEGLANYFSDPVFRAQTGDPKLHPVRALEYFSEVYSDPS